MNFGQMFAVFIITTGIATSCGVKVKDHDDSSYVKYTVYEQDHHGDSMSVSDCVPLDGSYSEQTTVIENNDSEELRFRWKLRHDEINFKFEQDDDELSNSSYETDLFIDGYSNTQVISTHSGKTYLVLLSGPKC